MSHRSDRYTVTMAKLYADQGYLHKAAEIYRHLVQQYPERGDLQAALAALEQQMAQQQIPDRKELGLLLREWIDLMTRCSHRKRRGQNFIKGTPYESKDQAGEGG